nr:ABC transporter permease subunit [Haladaptatus sp. R4]
MAETYTERGIEQPTEGEEKWLTDRRVKVLGIAVAGIFTLGVLFFLLLILTQFVDYQLLVTILPQFIEALILVLQIIVISSVLALIFGVLVGLGRVSQTGFTQRIATLYVEFFRGTPLLFQLFVVYLGVPALWANGQFPLKNWSFAAAIIGLTLNHTAYIGEAVKGGINSVSGGSRRPRGRSACRTSIRCVTSSCRRRGGTRSRPSATTSSSSSRTRHC